MNLGFSIRSFGIGRHTRQALAFTWLVNGKEFTLEMPVSADADFAALQLQQLADAIKAKQQEARKEQK